ncbi:MAG: L-threonylcarbamoyladenylate synthase [Acidobacteriota bacterium]|nr:L-threonylcarbamoyladenylate synthase [Acidobacteriota bacterium]
MPTKGPPGSAEIADAAALLRAGKLVAFPTETVYGLGANALDAAAVDRIYSAKGRPATSPLIVHVASMEMARDLTLRWPPEAETLARKFWPGPLTLVLRKHPSIPDRVTAGLDTVGLRMPSHPVALDLIRAAGVPLAAPSANRFGALSPTTADHVRSAFGVAVAMVLDGGPAKVGIESTVLSLAGSGPVLLRPGVISRADIEAEIGPVAAAGTSNSGSHASPGLHPRHYSPRTPLLLTERGQAPAYGRGALLWIHHSAPAARLVHMPADPDAYAAALYATLHSLDAEGWDWIAVERPPDEPRWAAVLDRLTRAARR